MADCFRYFSVFIIVQPENFDGMKATKIPIKNGVHVITTDNISDRYEVHDNDCSEQLNNSEIDSMATPSSRP